MVTTVVAKKSEFEKLQLGLEAAVLSLLIFSNLVSRFLSDSVFRPFATSLPSKSGGKISFPMEVSFKVCKNKLTSSMVLCFVLGLYSIDSKMSPPRYRKTRLAKNNTIGTRFFLWVGVNFMAWTSNWKLCPVHKLFSASDLNAFLDIYLKKCGGRTTVFLCSIIYFCKRLFWL